jgi:hypothetical protein
MSMICTCLYESKHVYSFYIHVHTHLNNVHTGLQVIMIGTIKNDTYKCTYMSIPCTYMFLHLKFQKCIYHDAYPSLFISRSVYACLNHLHDVYVL